VETGWKPTRMKVTCIKKTVLVQTGSGQYIKKQQPGLKPMRMKVKCIQKKEFVQTRSGQHTEEVHSKKGIGSD
jgi:hypothetical protein